MMFSRLQAAAHREQWAVRLWWSLMALASAVALALLLRHFGIRTDLVVVGTFLWMAAWLAPWTALLSLRRARRTGPPPAPGHGTRDDWRHFARDIGLLLDWARGAVRDPDLRARTVRAQDDLRRTLRAKPSREAIEAAIGRLVADAISPLRHALWRQLMPEIMPLAAAARERGAAAPSVEAFRRIQHDAMADAAAVALCRLYPALLMSDLEQAARQCVVAAAFYARPGDPLVLLSAAIAIEWGNFIRPWEPYRARCAALALIGEVDPEASLKFRDPAPPSLENTRWPSPTSPPPHPHRERPPKRPRKRPPPREPAPGAPAPAADASRHRHHRHRHRHHRHHHRHHRDSLQSFLSPLRDMARIFGSFFQRIRYLVRNWWLYR